jgi:hypothetical protein
MIKKWFFAALACWYAITIPAFSATAPSSPSSTRIQKNKPVKNRAVRKQIAAPIIERVGVGSVQWTCKQDKILGLNGNVQDDESVTVHWAGKHYKLSRVPTTTGAHRFHDPQSGMDLVAVPFKAMLLNNRGKRRRLADECRTPAMQANHDNTLIHANTLF